MPVCIAGMHRSGTSMVARLLNLCGVYLGEPNELPGPLPDNLEGHWENAFFKTVNDTILSRLGGGWDLPPAVAEGWQSLPELATVRDEAASLVHRFDAREPWGWKDPRNSLTLPFWLKLIPNVKVVICLRDPLAVVQSLRERGSSSDAFGLNLWLTYNERLLSCAQPRQRIITHYDAYFHDAQAELRRLLGLLGIPASQETVLQACSAIQSSLRHYRTRAVDLARAGVPEAVLTFYVDMCKDAGPVCAAALEASSPAENASTSSLEPLGSDRCDGAYLSRLEALVVQKERALQEKERSLWERDQAVEELSRQLSAQDHVIEVLNAQLAAIGDSTARRLVALLSRVRPALAPHGSLRGRTVRLGARALRLARREGVGACLREAATRILRRSLHLLQGGLWGLYAYVRPAARRSLPHAWRRQVSAWVHRFVGGRHSNSLSITGGAVAPSVDASIFGLPTAYDMICFPIIEWEHRFQRPQQLACQFARHGHRVFYLRLTFHGCGDQVEVRKVAERIFEIQLPGPTDVNRFLEPFPPEAREPALRALDDLCLRAGITDAVCMVQLPFWRELALELRERNGWKVVYDCMDEHEGLTALRPEMLQDELALSRQADLVLASSHKLWSKHASLAVRCQFLPNATDYEHFNRAAHEQPLAHLRRPIVGYYGAIMEWFDAAMIEEAARARPSWSFVLIGAVDTPSVEPLRQVPNVYLLGEQPYPRLPAFLQQFDACLIPFKLTPIIESTNPVKFYEYLSAGKPVVSVPMPELLPYPDLFYPVSNGQEAVAQVERALVEDSAARAAERMAWARQQTWEVRYGDLASALGSLHGLASIVIVSHNGLENIRACLHSIRQKTLYPRYEVIVVDNGSSTDVAEYLGDCSEEDRRVRVILNQQNLGFARANNIGLQAISQDSRYIVLLNNDTVVTRGWLGTLIHWLRDLSVGLVGPVTCPSGAANEAAIPVEYHDLATMEAFAQQHASPHRGRSFDIPMLAMYCLAMRREVFEDIGPLDERFRLGMFEDDDYSLRVRNRGYRVICAEDVFIHHVGRASFSRLQEKEYRALFDQNRQRFEAKWSVKWQPPVARAHRER